MFVIRVILSVFLASSSLYAGGEVVSVAGSGMEHSQLQETTALQAHVGQPYGVVIGPDDALYVCEISNHVVRRVDLETGQISCVAGTGKQGYSGDGGPGPQAQLNRPHSIALDNSDHLYICDIGNHRVRMLDLKTGIISTFAGTGERKATPDGAAVQGTPLNGPRALDFDGEYSLILALREGNAIYRINLKTQTLHHLAGTGKKGFTGNGGPALQATLSGPKGVAISPQGDIYFADTESHTIRVIRKQTGILETVVGDGKRGDGPDGKPLTCRTARPHGICSDAAGRIFIGDSENHKVRMFIE